MSFDSRKNQMATSFQYSSLPEMQIKQNKNFITKCTIKILISLRMPCLGLVFVIYIEQTNSCILKVHYNTYQTQRVHSICQYILSD